MGMVRRQYSELLFLWILLLRIRKTQVPLLVTIQLLLVLVGLWRAQIRLGVRREPILVVVVAIYVTQGVVVGELLRLVNVRLVNMWYDAVRPHYFVSLTANGYGERRIRVFWIWVDGWYLFLEAVGLFLGGLERLVWLIVIIVL